MRIISKCQAQPISVPFWEASVRLQSFQISYITLTTTLSKGATYGGCPHESHTILRK